MLKPGKRTVRKDLEEWKKYGNHCFIFSMKAFCGKEVTITKVFGSDCQIENDWHFWTEAMFEPLPEPDDDAEMEKELINYLNTMSPADMTEEQIKYCRQDFIAGWKRRGEREHEKRCNWYGGWMWFEIIPEDGEGYGGWSFAGGGSCNSVGTYYWGDTKERRPEAK